MVPTRRPFGQLPRPEADGVASRQDTGTDSAEVLGSLNAVLAEEIDEVEGMRGDFSLGGIVRLRKTSSESDIDYAMWNSLLLHRQGQMADIFTKPHLRARIADKIHPEGIGWRCKRQER